MRFFCTAAVFVFLFSVTIVQAQQITPIPDAAELVVNCEKLLPADRPMPTGADAPSIKIVQPSIPVVFGQTVTIEIQTAHFDVTSEGRHWHLWVNGQLQGMVYQPTAIIDLAPGTYQVCATLGDSNHLDIGIPAAVEFTLEQAAAGTPTPTLPVAREAAQVTNDSGIGTGQIALIIGGGLLAAVGGWWLGKRMPKGAK